MSIWATNKACTIDGIGSVLLVLSDIQEVVLHDVKYVSSIWKTNEKIPLLLCVTLEKSFDLVNCDICSMLSKSMGVCIYFISFVDDFAWGMCF